MMMMLGLVIAAMVFAAEAAAQSQSSFIQLRGAGAGEFFALSIGPLPQSAEKELALILISVGPECRLPERFEVPVQLSQTSFQLKRMARLNQRRQDTSCSESLLMAYTPAEFHYLAAASSVVMHLPTGPLAWSDEAVAYARSKRPAESAPYAAREADFNEVYARLITMTGAGKGSDARSLAEAIAPLYVARPPSEALRFYAALGMARRSTDDLSAAAAAYEVAALIAAASNESSEFTGIAHDNLATVRRLLRQFDAAASASDRALATLAVVAPGSRSYGGALNNRALLLVDQQRYENALEHSERALAVLREVFKNDSAALAPFIEDNRIIREKLEKR